MNRHGSKQNSILNKEWGGVKGVWKKLTSSIRRVMGKEVVRESLEDKTAYNDWCALLIGQRVSKKSHRPFKSTFKINTVKDICKMEALSEHKGRTVYGASFVEDLSVVECERLVVV